MRKLLCILFLLCSVITYSQTFYSPVIVKKTLRVDGRTALGGIDYTEDLTITADTILINGLDGTGNILIIDVDGNVLRGTGAGTGGVSGLVPTEVLFGKSDGTIDQDAQFTFNETDNSITLTGVSSGYLVTNGTDDARVRPGELYVGSATLGQIVLDGGKVRFTDTGGDLFSIGRTAWSTDMDLNFPAAKGVANEILKVGSVVGDNVNLVWAADATGTVTSIATTSPIGGGTITTTGTLNLLGSASDRMLYTTGVNTWAETVSTSFGRSLMDDANAAAGLATLGIPVDNTLLLFGDGTGVINSSDLSYNTGTGIFDINKFEVDGGNGWISSYEGASLTNGLFPIGRTSDGVLKLGTITSSDLTVGYSDPNITLSYATGSIVNADINGSAAIDASKINTGVVSNAEFNYVDGVTSSIQTQLDNKGYVLTLTGTQNTVADATVYYTGAIPAGTGTTADINRVYLPMGGTITSCYVSFYNSGTLSSGESSTFAIRYDNTTDVTVSTAVLNNATQTVASNTGLAQAVSQGHYIEGKFTTATWATNPTNIRWTVTIFIRT